jgi:hypothetical protein
VFEAIAYPTILVGTRKVAPGKPGSSETVRALNWVPVEGEDPKESVKRFPERFAAEAFEMPQSELADSTDWQFIPRSSGEILARLRSTPLNVQTFTVDTVYRGITTGYNGAFEIDETERLALIREDQSSSELIKPFGLPPEKWSSLK